MSKDQRVDQGRWKFRKGPADAVGQFDRTPLHFFDEGQQFWSNMSQVRYLPNVTPRFLTMGLASVVS